LKIFSNYPFLATAAYPHLFINYPILEKFKQETTKPAIYSVPDISSELSNMRLFARYAVQKNFFLQLHFPRITTGNDKSIFFNAAVKISEPFCTFRLFGKTRKP
jgi:hypothetical protein